MSLALAALLSVPAVAAPLRVAPARASLSTPGLGEQGLSALAAAPSAPAPAALLPAPADRASLKAWIEATQADLLKRDPELFQEKMERAAESKTLFIRTFPSLFNRILAESIAAPRIKDSEELLLAGDLLNAGQFLVVQDGRRPVPQLYDLDQAQRGPAALDAAQAFAGAALLGRGERERAALFKEARDAYRRSARQSYAQWAREAAREPAVSAAEARLGAEVEGEEARRALALAGLDGGWRVFRSETSGGGSYGGRRYRFLRADEMRELKKLSARSVVEYFTGRGPEAPARERVGEAYEYLPVPFDARTVRGEDGDWLLRERRQDERPLDRSDRRSLARVMGGALAQYQLAQGADPAGLVRASSALAPKAAEGIVARFKDLRRELAALVQAGDWAAPRGSR